MAFPTSSAATATTFATSVTTMAVNLPASISSGDLLIAHVGVRNAGTWTPPTNWLLLEEKAGGGATGETGVWYKIATGSEGASATWTTGTATTAAWQVRKITGWHGTAPPEFISANGDSASVTSPSLMPTWGTEDTLFLSLAGSSANTMSFTATPTNYSDLTTTTASTGGGASNAGSAIRQLAALSDDPGTFTTSTNRWWAAFTVAVRPAVSDTEIVLRSSLSGTQTNTVVTITLPSYQTSDTIVLVVASNNANAQTFGSNVTATSIANGSNRLNAWKIVPQDGSQTSFTLTVGTNSVFSWWIGAYKNVDAAATIYGVANNIGNSTTSPVEVPALPTGFIANGTERLIYAGSVNATGTWTATSESLFNSNTTSNASMAVASKLMTADTLSATFTAFDRALSGTPRNESALALVLQKTPNAPLNILTNPSFEDTAGTSAGWETEGNTVGAVAYTKLSSGAADGARMQQMQYAGQSGDAGKMFAIYQSPITAAPGDVFTFSILLSGSKANCDLVVGVEGFSTGMVYISEEDVYVTSLTGTLTEYEVEYTCPAETVAVAVYIQANDLQTTTAITVQMDKAILTKVAGGGGISNKHYLGFF